MSKADWDFYPCRVDDAPASIFVDIGLMGRDVDPASPCLYVAFLPIDEPLGHGMGSAADMERLGPVEDALFERVTAAGGVPCGRLRNHGIWQVCAQGPKGLPFAAWVEELAGPGVEVTTKDDPEWDYVRDFLLPDAERMQWIMDRRVCDQLLSHGDVAEVPRPVDHFIDCSAEPPAELVTAVVMSLAELAESHGADYDGWGCEVCKG